MTDVLSLTKLSFFKVSRYEYAEKFACDFRNYPRPHYCMGFVLQGNGCFTHEHGEENISAGDVIFVPVTSRYSAQWRGEPNVCYISFHFSFDGYDLFSSKRELYVQKVSIPEQERMRALFERAYEFEKNGGDEGARLAALGAFYEAMSIVFPRLVFSEMQNRDRRIEKALEFIALNYTRPLTVGDIAQACNMSTSHFYACFKNGVGIPPIEYKNELCIHRAMLYLVTDNRSIAEIGELLGFESTAYFRKVFKRVTGKTPKEYRRSAGET